MMYRFRRGRVLAIAAVAAAALALSACNAATPSPSSSSSGVLKLAADDGSPTFEKNFNPYVGARLGSKFIYEPLFVVNSLDGSETPFLGESYEFTDPSTITVTLRDGVTWSDGTAFSADDVVFTFNLLKDFPALDGYGVWQRLASVSADGNVVTFSLSAADATAFRSIEQTLIVPEHIWEDIADPTTFTNEDPIGTGPFLAGSFAPNQYSIVKNPTYWQADKVEIEEIDFPASNTQADIVNNGYDWGYAYISDVDNVWVAPDPEHRSYWFPPGGVIALFPNLTTGPLADVNVRRGISEAFDRDAIADDAVEGYVDGAPQTGLMLPGFADWTDPSIPDEGKVTQDTDAALASFAAAGYTLTDGKLVDSSGTQLALSIMVANGYTDWLRAAQAMQQQLKDVGISITIDQPEEAGFYQQFNAGDFDLAMGGFGGQGNLYLDFNTLLSSYYLKPVGDQSAVGDWERYSNPDVDAALEELKVTTDTARQKELGYQIQQAMVNDIPVIALYYGGLWGIFDSSRFTGWPSADDPYAAPRTWDASVLLIVTHVKRVS
ncbi:MAG: ABC transporter substrate-binding protein [Nocardioidaceae bacterium]